MVCGENIEVYLSGHQKGMFLAVGQLLERLHDQRAVIGQGHHEDRRAGGYFVRFRHGVHFAQGNYLIGLREGLEAALVISILIAYLVRTERQHLIPRVWAGVAAAVAISLAFGALLTFGPRGMEERTEELIAGSLSLLAACKTRSPGPS